MKTQIKIVCISILALATTGLAQAQFTDTQSSIEKAQARSLWFSGSNNAAGLTIDGNEFIDRVALGYNHIEGDFRRHQAAQTQSAITFTADGGLKLGGAYLWGLFDFTRRTDRGTVWNASLLDPFRNMPFVVADPNVSDWQIQTYDMQVKASTPFLLNDRLALGLSLSYHNIIGAKQVDPRATNRFYAIHVKPGLVWRLNEKSFIGVSGEFLNHREDYQPTIINEEQLVNLMRGLGFNTLNIVGGNQGIRERWSIKNFWGGELQFNTRIGRANTLIAVGYRGGSEELFDDFRTPFRIGTMEGTEISANLSTTFGSTNNLNLITLRGVMASWEAVEYIQTLDPRWEVNRWIVQSQRTTATFDAINIQASYDFFRGRSETDYAWRAGAFANFNVNQDAFIMPVGIQDITAFSVGANAKYNWAINSRNQLLAGVRFMHRMTLDEEFAYLGPNATAPVITNFVRPDFDIRAMNYNLLGLELTYSRNLQNMGFFISGHLDYLMAGNLSRIISSVRVGFTF